MMKKKKARNPLVPHPRDNDPERLYREWLAERAAEAENIAEIGVFAGRSTIRMVEAQGGVGKLWAIDHWQGVPDDQTQHVIYKDLRQTERNFRLRMRPYIKAGRVQVLKMASLEGADWVARNVGPILDLIFLDGDHRYGALRADIQAWRPLLRAGGILAGHDYHWPGVKRAVDECLPGFERGPGSVWFKGELGAGT